MSEVPLYTMCQARTWVWLRRASAGDMTRAVDELPTCCILHKVMSLEPQKGHEPRASMALGSWPELIAQKVYINLFYISQFPQKSVNLSFIITAIKNKWIDLCGN